MMKIAFKAKVKTDGKTRQPDIGEEYYPLIKTGAVIYNADYTSCICIIEPIDCIVTKAIIEQYNFEVMPENRYEEIDKEYAGFINIINYTPEMRSE